MSNVKPYGDKNKEVIQFLSDVRKQKGISLRALAKILKVYPNSVVQWLDVNGNPQLDSIVRIGNALGVTFSMSNTRSYNLSADQLIEMLAKARVYEEITTRELAEITDIVLPSICGILSHKIMPRLNSFLLIADALGIDLEMYLDE